MEGRRARGKPHGCTAFGYDRPARALGIATMTARLLDGKTIAAEIREQVQKRSGSGWTADCAPRTRGRARRPERGLQVYVRNKRNACEPSASTPSCTPCRRDHRGGPPALIDELNAREAIDGILVQLPLPPQIDAEKVTERILPTKDVDGFHPTTSVARPAPAAAAALHAARRDDDALPGGVQLEGLDAVIIGQSNIVGRPMALELLAARCTITVCHSRTKISSQGPWRRLLVAAIGKAVSFPATG